MKKMIVFCLMAFPLLVLAQGGAPTDPPSSEQWVQLIAQLLTVKSLSALGIAAVAIQLIMFGVRQFVSGKAKLAIVLGLSAIAGVLAAMLQGLSLGAALVSAPVLASLQVAAWEIYSQFIKKDSIQV